MTEIINIYCDESCHLQYDKEKVMLVSCVWCEKHFVRQISEELRELKNKHNISRFAELKWTKVSKSKIDYYSELLDYFFSNKNLHFRTIIIPDKNMLNHSKFNQNHNIWYYKMIYHLVKYLFTGIKQFNIYVDKKENSNQAKKELQKTMRLLRHYYNPNVFMQNIRSHESELMQLNDFLQGAVGFYTRGYMESSTNIAKVEIVRKIINKYNINLCPDKGKNKDTKFNILIWEATNVR